MGKKRSPFLAAVRPRIENLPCSKAIDTLRLFTDVMNFVDHDGDGWLALLDISSSYGYDRRSIFPHLFLWMLQLCSPEIRTHFIEYNYTVLLWNGFNFGNEKLARLLLDLGPVDAIETKVVGSYTMLQANFLWPGGRGLDMILAFEPDLHHLSSNPKISPREETPLSLALYSYESFSAFAQALRKRHTNMDEFVLQELREDYPLKDDGWTRQTLRALFQLKVQPDAVVIIYSTNIRCDECYGYSLYWLKVGVAWQRYLEMFKERHSQIATEISNSNEGMTDIVSENTAQNQLLIDLMRDFDDISNCQELHTDSGTESSGDSSSGSELAECETDQPSWEQRFWQHEVVCTHCWYSFKNGLGKPPWARQSDSAEEDDNSEDEGSEDEGSGDEGSEEDFSPFLINT